MRETENVRWLTAGGAALMGLAAVAVILIGIGVYRRRRRSAQPATATAAEPAGPEAQTGPDDAPD
jgi:hypothetical protein